MTKNKIAQSIGRRTKHCAPPRMARAPKPKKAVGAPPFAAPKPDPVGDKLVEAVAQAAETRDSIRESLDHLSDLVDDALNHMADALVNLEEVESGIVPWLSNVAAGTASELETKPYAFENNARFAADRLGEVYRHATRTLAAIQSIGVHRLDLWLKTQTNGGAS